MEEARVGWSHLTRVNWASATSISAWSKSRFITKVYPFSKSRSSFLGLRARTLVIPSNLISDSLQSTELRVHP